LAGLLDDDAQCSVADAPPTLALTATEIGELDRLVNDKPKARQKTLSHYLIKIARLGGYLARASDPPPGNTVMWRGLSRLTDIALGAMFGVLVRGRPSCGFFRSVADCRYGYPY
jgi:hypothetical protein